MRTTLLAFICMVLISTLMGCESPNSNMSASESIATANTDTVKADSKMKGLPLPRLFRSLVIKRLSLIIVSVRTPRRKGGAGSALCSQSRRAAWN